MVAALEEGRGDAGLANAAFARWGSRRTPLPADRRALWEALWTEAGGSLPVPAPTKLPPARPQAWLLNSNMKCLYFRFEFAEGQNTNLHFRLKTLKYRLYRRRF